MEQFHRIPPIRQMESQNQNNISRDIEEGKSTGRYKDCIHLTITSWVNAYGRTFATYCKQGSLEFPRMSSRSSGQPRCPDDCHFFVDRTEAALRAKRDELAKIQREIRERRKEKIIALLNLIPALFRWFSGLPQWAQISIIILLILAFAPSWIPPIQEFLKLFLKE